MSSYSVIKLLHQALIVLSVAGFTLRWSGGLAGAGWVRGRTARILTHAVDTLLLASGLWLVWAWGAALGTWFVVKMAGLVLYVVLGSIALRATLSPRTRQLAGLGALLVVGWMASVAVLKQPAGLFAQG